MLSAVRPTNPDVVPRTGLGLSPVNTHNPPLVSADGIVSQLCAYGPIHSSYGYGRTQRCGKVSYGQVRET